jgi:hypothetical protein
MPAAEPAAAATAPAACCVIPALTPVRIELLATMNSNLSQIGSHFAIRLAAPIDLPGGMQIPAGAIGSGDVVHAAKSGFGGKPGELILAARYLDYQGVRIPLRSLNFNITGTSMRGKDRTDTSVAVVIVASWAGIFISGGQVNVPAGTIAIAKTSAAVTVPPPAGVPASAAASAAAPSIPPTEKGSLNP